MTTERDNDNAVERLLSKDGGELGELYRRLPRMEPPRRLDRAVLGEAARAVHGRAPRKQRWRVGIGSAAGLVLAAGVAWHVGQDALRQQSPHPMRDRPSFVPVEPLDESARSKHAAESSNADALNAPLPALRVDDSALPVKKQVEHPQKHDNKTRPSGAPIAAPPMPAAAAQEEHDVSQPSAPIQKPSAVRDEANAAVIGAAAAPSPNPDGTVERQRGSSSETKAQTRHRGTPIPSSSVELRRDMQLAPQDWLAHIQQLLRQGRRQQAIESLQLFRRAHPDWQLSDELKAMSN